MSLHVAFKNENFLYLKNVHELFPNPWSMLAAALEKIIEDRQA